MSYKGFNISTGTYNPFLNNVYIVTSLLKSSQIAKDCTNSIHLVAELVLNYLVKITSFL